MSDSLEDSPHGATFIRTDMRQVYIHRAPYTHTRGARLFGNSFNRDHLNSCDRPALLRRIYVPEAHSYSRRHAVGGDTPPAPDPAYAAAWADAPSSNLGGGIARVTVSASHTADRDKKNSTGFSPIAGAV